MECSQCNLRSAVGYCSECKVMLCDECGLTCEQCEKLICPDHARETPHGRTLCTKCYAERKTRHASRRKTREVPAEEEIPEEEEIPSEERVLTASIRKPPPPWKLSLYTAIVGAVAILLILFIPTLRASPLPGGGSFPNTVVLLILPIVAGMWAIIGLVKQETREEAVRCVVGLCIAIATCALAFGVMYADAVRAAERRAEEAAASRKNMTPEELAQWRRDALNRFNPDKPSE